MHDLKAIAAIAALALPTGALAEGWTLDPDMSNVSFGSIKNEYVGEIHHFSGLDGSVDAEGTVSIEIDLASVETLIDIRNERMVEHVFGDAATATISAQIDPAAVENLAVGDGMTIEAPGTLTLLGNEVDLDASFFVARLAENRAMVTTEGMLMLATDEAGIDAGVDILKEIAGLDSITRVSPVTMRLVFEREG